MLDYIKEHAVFLILAVVIIGTTVVVNKASVQRTFKNIESEYSNGLDRVVTVYDYNGNEITSYEGKIDVENSDSDGKVKFDLNGKRTIIYGGIVVVQEK